MPEYLKSANKKLILIIIFAFIIRLAGIASRPIWYDEAFSILFSEKGLSAMLYGTLSQTGTGSADIHPLGYYTVLWGWIELFGESIIAARLLSIFFNLISILLVYKIAVKLFSEKTASISAILISILPFQVHFAQEIRMYSLLSMWLLLTTYAFLQGRDGNWKWWIVFGISSALAQYTHNLAAFYLISLALLPLIQKDWKTLRAVVFAGLGSIILYLPWLIYLPSQFSKVNTAYWVEKPGFEKIFTLFLFYIPHLPLPGTLLLPGLGIAMIVIVLAAFQTILAKRENSKPSNWIIWCAYMAFMPPAMLWVISQFVPVYIERALLPSHAMFCIWVTCAFFETKIPKPIQLLAVVFVTVGACMGLYQHLTYKGFPYAPYQVINESIQSQLQNGDVIVHSSKLSYLPAFYFDPELHQGYIGDTIGSSTDTLAPATQEILKLKSYESIEAATMDAPRVWFVIYQNSIEEYTIAGKKTHPHLEYLDSNFTLSSIETFDDIRLYIYTRSIP